MVDVGPVTTLPGAKISSSLHGVPQLADVPGPVVLPAAVASILENFRPGTPELAASPPTSGPPAPEYPQCGHVMLNFDGTTLSGRGGPP